MEYPDF